MKLLTLNTHSLVEENYSEKLSCFVEAIAEEKPDIIALQEVNQTIGEKPVQPHFYIPCTEKAVIRSDNHVYRAAEMLRSLGAEYYWTWLPLKKGYGKYDEGVALMSRSRITDTEVLQVSKINDYDNWKTRSILGIRTEKAPEERFFSVHYGWWEDEEESFREQWHKTASYLSGGGRIWLMGDFNNPAEVRGEGYDLIKNDGWFDAYILAEKKDSGVTVEGKIDGWRDKERNGMRIDQIWCSEKFAVSSAEVIFNGSNRRVVSDHYGVMVTYEK